MIPRRALLSLRQQATTAATLKSNSSISRFSISSSNPNPNPNFFSSWISQNKKRLPLRYLSLYLPSPSVSVTSSKANNGLLVVRCLSTRSMNDSSSNRPPKETILLDGCDFEHWLVVMEPPDPNLTRDEIICSYIKTLVQVLGSEEEARKQIYSVSTKHYFAFGCIVSEELSYKIKELPRVRWVLPDSYLDVKNKSYGGEPFIDGQAVPYDPKYHEEWVRNNARANERSRRNDRPRNYDRSRNFERRGENMTNRDMPPPPPPPMTPNPGFQNPSGLNRDMPPVASHEIQNRAPPSLVPNRDMPSPVQSQDFSNRGMPPPVQNRDFQNRDIPPPRQNQDFQNSYTPQPMQSRDFQSRDMPPPMENQGFQNRNMPPLTQNWNYQSRDMPPPTQNRDFQSRNMPPPTQNRDFQSRDMPPPTQNRDFQSRDMPPPTHSWNYQSRDMPPPTQNRDFQSSMPPPMKNQDFQNRDMPPPIQNRDFQNRDVPPPVQNRDFQYRDMGTVPNRDHQNRDMSTGGMPNRDYQSREMSFNMGTGIAQSGEYQGRGSPDNLNVGNVPNRDHQTRDMPNGDYENVANRNF